MALPRRHRAVRCRRLRLVVRETETPLRREVMETGALRKGENPPQKEVIERTRAPREETTLLLCHPSPIVAARDYFRGRLE